jgi:hypothetical protein
MDHAMPPRASKATGAASSAAVGAASSAAVAQFSSPRNLLYLRSAFRTGDAAALEWAARVRRLPGPPADLWAEVRGLNRGFVAAAARTAGPTPVVAAVAAMAAAEEPLHMRMFEEDSLHSLNDDTTVAALADESDAPWSRGDPDRSGAEATAEYWSGGLGALPPRLMRRETIPFWQRGGRGGYEHDIGETLGDAPSELGSQVRSVRRDVGRRSGHGHSRA